MSVPMDCQLIGRWRIVAAGLWEDGYLDLCGPAKLDIRADGHGEIAFGALQATPSSKPSATLLQQPVIPNPRD